MSWLARLLVRSYQRWISPLTPPRCRFQPTCSNYALEALARRGFFLGLYFTIFRILRCNPFCRSGYDPVPLRGLGLRDAQAVSLDRDWPDPRAAKNLVGWIVRLVILGLLIAALIVTCAME